MDLLSLTLVYLYLPSTLGGYTPSPLYNFALTSSSFFSAGTSFNCLLNIYPSAPILSTKQYLPTSSLRNLLHKYNASPQLLIMNNPPSQPLLDLFLHFHTGLISGPEDNKRLRQLCELCLTPEA